MSENVFVPLRLDVGGRWGWGVICIGIQQCHAGGLSPKPAVLTHASFLASPPAHPLHHVFSQVGDKAGLSLPRACCTGLCGTCTSDLMDPSFTFKGEVRG